jgi:hypothetical protein
LTIVTDRAPRRKRPKSSQPAEIKVPRVVQHVPKWKSQPKLKARDPKVEAEIIALFRRLGINTPDDLFDR